LLARFAFRYPHILIDRSSHIIFRSRF